MSGSYLHRRAVLRLSAAVKLLWLESICLKKADIAFWKSASESFANALDIVVASGGFGDLKPSGVLRMFQWSSAYFTIWDMYICRAVRPSKTRASNPEKGCDTPCFYRGSGMDLSVSAICRIEVFILTSVNGNFWQNFDADAPHLR